MFCEKLCGVGIPSWVNRAAGVGSLAKSMLGGPKSADPSASVSSAPMDIAVLETDVRTTQPTAAASVLQSHTTHLSHLTIASVPLLLRLFAQVDLAEAIDLKKLGCLNQSPAHPIAALFGGAGKKAKSDKDRRLESDADEQLLLMIPFTKPVALRSCTLAALSPSECGRLP